MNKGNMNDNPFDITVSVEVVDHSDRPPDPTIPPRPWPLLSESIESRALRWLAWFRETVDIVAPHIEGVVARLLAEERLMLEPRSVQRITFVVFAELRRLGVDDLLEMSAEMADRHDQTFGPDVMLRVWPAGEIQAAVSMGRAAESAADERDRLRALYEKIDRLCGVPVGTTAAAVNQPD